MRIEEHPILKFERERKINFYFNGIKMEAYEGETIASALHANGIKVLSHSRKGRARGFFCGIGKCSSCLMTVNGTPNVRTCITMVKDGMIVEGDKYDLPESFPYRKPIKEKIDVSMAIVGAGPAGLAAAIESAENGIDAILIDENPRLGGQLIKQTHKFFGSSREGAGKRGIEIAKELEEEATKKAKILLNTSVIGYYDKGYHFLVAANQMDGILYEIKAKKIIFSTGAQENMLVFEGNDLPGVYGAGGVQTLTNVYGVKPGNSGVIIGAGNVGLILSYQLLQAGVDVKAIVEAMPKIGGYFVHAAKVRRNGVPIYTRHTIKEAYGKDRVEGAKIVALDEKWNTIEGSEKDIKCDFIAVSVGLTPSTRLVQQTGAKIKFISAAGGWVALHNEYMETTKDGIYVAGDASNIEEASTAIIEGKIASLHASNSLKKVHGYDKKMKEYMKRLEELRSGIFGERAKFAKNKIYEEYYEIRENRRY
ncbi:MAG: FAD-dependent oxidoreductase [Thermoplasmata archaeon]|nr:FAD-dependent oxidoreductase [Thermoplasmata archaeon]